MSMPADRYEPLLRLACWAVIAFVGAVMLTQAAGLDPGAAVAAAQTLTPYGAALLVPVLVLASVRRWWPIVGVAGAVGVAAAGLATPLIFPAGQPAPAAGATGTDIAVVNLLYENDRTTDIADALAAADPDVIVFTEFTPEHQAGFERHPIAAALPHRVELAGYGAGGTAVWSRVPLAENDTADMANFDVDVDVDGMDGTFRLWAVHPPTPFHGDWTRDLRTIADRSQGIEEPLVVAGDFNASYWHPVFRDVLGSGLTSAHIAGGRGFSTSWPTDRLVPAFVRIDHALTNDRLTSTAIRDLDVPGSDHRGFVVTVAPTR